MAGKSVSFITNAGNLASRQRRRAGAFTALQTGAMRAAVNEELHEARTLSGTQFASTKELARRHHPYAKGGTSNTPEVFGNRLRKGFTQGPMPAPPFFINKQSGELFDSWRTRVGPALGNIVGTLYNIADYSRWMAGTKYMIRRPILEEVRRRCKARMLRRFRGAMVSANKK